MNYRNILKVYKLERELSDDETALLNTLRGMTDAERELFGEALQPEKVVKVVKERKIEKCGVCDYTRRAAHHKDPNHKDYHEFHTRMERPEKSKRASSLETALKGRAGATKNNGIFLCGASLPTSGANCNLPQGHALHESTGYADCHPFQPSTTALPATRLSAANGGGENGGQSLEIEREDASNAVHAGG